MARNEQTTSAYKLLKKDNIIKFVHKWIELKKIISSEVIHIQKGKHRMYSLRRLHSLKCNLLRGLNLFSKLFLKLVTTTG